MRYIFISSVFLWLFFVACDSDPAVRKLIEERKVEDVLVTLFVETDNRDWIKVEACFADTVLFDMTSLTGGEPVKMTPQQITDGWDNGLKALQAVHHQVGNFKIEVSWKGADAFCYGIASHYLPNKSGEDIRTFVGSYDFHLIQINDKWRIDRFKFNSKYISGNLNLEGLQ